MSQKITVTVLQLTVGHRLLLNIIKEQAKTNADMLQIQNYNYFTITLHTSGYLS